MGYTEDKKINYVNGITPAVAKRIGNFAFGKKMQGFNIDKEDKCYVFIVKEDCPEKTIEYFQNFWGAGWKVKKTIQVYQD